MTPFDYIRMKKDAEMERRLTVRLPEELAEEIDNFTNEVGMSFAEFLRRACQEKLDRAAGISPPCVDKETMRGLILEVLEEEELLKKE